MKTKKIPCMWLKSGNKEMLELVMQKKASLGAIAEANKSSKLNPIAVARSVGHAVETAHIADHSICSAWYDLKALKNADKSIYAERKWQDEQLLLELRSLS